MLIKEVFRFLKALPGSLLYAVVLYLPSDAGVMLRRWYYSKKFRKCGKNLVIGTNVRISGPSMIEVGDNVMIRENVILHTGVPANPQREKREILELTSYQGKEKGSVTIGSHSRIAFGAVILGYGGIRIGEKCGIGPGAIILSESFHYKGKDRNVVYKYSQGALPEEQCVIQGFIEFMDGGGVASNVIVLPGAVIGRDSWVGPNSVVGVRGRIESDVIAKGDPAVTVFKRPYVVSEKSDE